MRVEHRLSTLVPLFVISVISLSSAQTTTTQCNASGNYLNCTSNTSPSAQQQYEQDMQQFRHGMANLATAIAERRAAAAAQEAAWATAATEQAKQAAMIAKSNYDVTTVALSRFAVDTAAPMVSRVNTGLVLDWTLLNGVESRRVERGENNVTWDFVTRYALTDTPTGGQVLRIDQSVKTMQKKEHVTTYLGTTRYEPATGILLYSLEGRPRYQTIPPSYESRLLVGTHAFGTRMQGRGYDVTVPPGTLDGTMLHAAIAAIPGDLPPDFQIWIVNEQGEVVPAKIRVAGRKTVREPVGPASGTCLDTSGRAEKREAVILKIAAGTTFETIDVLATAPHFSVYPELKCRIAGR